SSPAAASGHPLQRLVLAAVPLDKQTPREAVSLLPSGAIWIMAHDEDLAAKLADRLDLLGHQAKLVTPADLPPLAPPARLAGLVVLAPPGQVDKSYLTEVFQMLQLAAAGLR